MRNIKLEKKLIGTKWWPHVPVVEVKLDLDAKKLEPDLSTKEKEKVIQSWKKVAVLKVEPEDILVKVGFMTGTYAQILNFPLVTKDGMFGMRIGSENMNFFVLADDLLLQPKLSLVEIADEKDKKYKDLPLY